MREMRAIAFVTKLIDDGVVKPNGLKRMLIHSIEAEEFMRTLSVASKLNADLEFLIHLRDVGRTCAEDWLERNFAKVNRESSVDIHEAYL
jgi:NTE family protein